MQPLESKSLDDLARIIASRLEMLHMGGRLYDKEGKPMNATGTGIPLSKIDKEEIFLAARAGIIAGRHLEESFLEIWRRAAREARRALYRITKCPTFSSRARAITAGEKAREHFEETLEDELSAIAEEDRLDFSAPDEDQVSFAAQYRSARTALIEYWSHRLAFANYNRGKHDFRGMLATLSRLARDARDGRFTLPRGKHRDKKDINRLERLARAIVKGRVILGMETPAESPTRRASIGAIAPHSSGTAQARATIVLKARGSARAPLTAFDWEGTTAAMTLHKRFPKIAEKIAPRATRADLESLAKRFE